MTKAGRIQNQIDRMASLYATGPLPPVFFQWVDQSLTVLRTVFGEDSAQVAAFLEAAGDDIHDPEAVMLPLHMEWGIHARMSRCRLALEGALTTLQGSAV